MRIFVAGVSCVGKITIGARLASLLEYRFFDLDVETERFFGTSIERLPKPAPDVERFPPPGISSLEGRSISTGQLQLRHCAASDNRGGVADHCHQIPMSPCLGPKDAEAVLSIVEGDALDEARQGFLGGDAVAGFMRESSYCTGCPVSRRRA
jgi:hypothetical protein